MSYIAAAFFILAEPKKWGEGKGTPDNDDSDDDHSHDQGDQQSTSNAGSNWMEKGVIESGDSHEVVAAQDICSTESDDSADDVKTSGFIETNLLLQDRRQKSPVDSSGKGCMSCREKCALQKAKLHMVGKLKTGLAKWKGAATVLRDRRVFLSITLYVMLSFTVTLTQEVSILMHAYALLLNDCLCYSIHS